MLFKASTKVSIYSGIHETPRGDVLPSRRPIAVSVPAALYETTTTAFSREDGRSYQVHRVTCMLPSYTPVKQDNRIYDENTNTYYHVTSVTQNYSPLVAPPMILTLERIDV
jgi:hypothetical protein